MKTVKELAIELGVSKSRILQVIKKLPITKQPKLIDRKYFLNDEDVINISNFVKGMRNKKNDVVSDGLSPSYRKLIDNLQEQNRTKDLQIEQLQKLLENQQILLLPRFYVSTSKSIIKALINMRSFEIQLSPIG